MKNSKNKKPGIVSVFTGAGGLDLGFLQAGFELLCAIELAEWACDTLRLNHSSVPILGPPNSEGNLRALDDNEITEAAKRRGGSIDILIGGPPCQPFSQAATQRFRRTDSRFKRRGFEDAKRGTLLLDFAHLIERLRPRAFVLENVPGLVSVDSGEQLAVVLGTLKDAGYSIAGPKLIEMADYGVPQFRRRLFIWGSQTVGNPSFPEPSFSQTGNLLQRPFNVVVEALVGMPKDLPNHVPRDHKSESVARYRTLAFGQREHLGRVDRLDPRKPSKTIIAGGSNGGGRSHLHPFIARTLTVRESARLQTFDDDFVFEGSSARQFTQVGNAVPPLFAETLARHIMQEEFGVSNASPYHFGQYLYHDEDVDMLVSRLWEESIQEKPEWIYFDSIPSSSQEEAGQVAL